MSEINSLGHGNTSGSGWPNPLPPTLCLRIRKFNLVFQQFEQLVEPKESAACRITSQLIDSNCKFESSVSNLTKTTREKIRPPASKTCSLSTSKKKERTTQWTPAYLSQLSELQSILYAADMEKYYNTHTRIKIPACELKKLYSLENKRLHKN